MGVLIEITCSAKGSRTNTEAVIRIIIFGASLQQGATDLRMTYLEQGVELIGLSSEERLELYLQRHEVRAYIVDQSGDRAARRMREYENVEVGYKLTDPALLEATILEIIASRPRRPKRAA